MSSSTFSRSERKLPVTSRPSLSTQSARSARLARCRRWRSAGRPARLNGRAARRRSCRNLARRELQDHLVDGDALALASRRCCATTPSCVGDEDVLHLHRLDHGEPLAGTHRLPGLRPRRRPAGPASATAGTCDRSGGALNGISASQLGGARRQHADLDLRAVVGDAQRQRRALDLGAERRAVDAAVDRDRRRSGLANAIAARPAGERRRRYVAAVDAHRRPASARRAPSASTSTTTNCSPSLQLVAGQLAADARRARQQAAVRTRPRARAGSRGRRARPRPRRNPCGYSSAMKPVLKSPAAKRGCAEQRRLERDVARRCRGSRSALSASRIVAIAVAAVGAAGDQLGDHRVVVHRDLAAFVDAGVDAHAGVPGAVGAPATSVCAGGWNVTSRPVVGRKPRNGSSALMRHSIAQPLARDRRACVNGSFSPAATRIICSTRSSPVIALGHRMLDLQPRVHLEEVEALVLADDELDRAGRLVVHRLGQRHRLLAHRLARRRRRGTGAALPRSPSGGGAGSSTRAPTGRRSCRARRRAPGSRCGAAPRRTSR